MNFNRNFNCFIFLIYWIFYLSKLNLTTAAASLCVKDCCDIGKVLKSSCKKHQTCMQLSVDSNEGVCMCMKNYSLIDGVCVEDVPPTEAPPTPTQGGSYIPKLLILPLPIFGLGGILVFLAKKCGLTERLYALRARRYNTVFVSSANVDDDAPIT